MDEFKRSFGTSTGVSFLTLIGFLLRLLYLHDGFWRDETHVYYIASANNIAALISRLIPVECTPPAFYVLMHHWVNIFGTSDVAMKIPSFIFGLLLIPVIYLLGKEVGGRSVGIISAVIVTFSPLAAFFSLQCRAYCLAALLYCFAGLFYCRIINSNKSVKYPILLSLSLLVALYVHYTALLLIAALVLTTIILWRRKQASMSMLRWGFVFLVPLLAFIPWLKVLSVHIQTSFRSPIPFWYEWVGMLIANIRAGNPVLSEANLVILYDIVFFLLFAWIIFKIQKQEDFLNSMGIKNPNKLMAITMCFLLPAAMEGYATPQAVRYMFPFAPFEWILFATCAVCCWNYYFNWTISNQSNRRQKIAILSGTLLALAFIYFDVESMITRNKLPLSGARPFSHDLSAGKFKNTAFVFIPDATVCTIDYYVRHNKRVTNAEALLSGIHGYTRWNDKTPCIPAQYEALFNDPNCLPLVKKNISNLPLDKYQTLIFVCESGAMNEAGEQIATNLREWLDKTYELKAINGYMGRLEGYIMFVYDRI